MMRVLIDALNFKPGQTGIRSYTRELVRALGDRGDCEIVVLTSDPGGLVQGPARMILAPETTRSFAGRTTWRERHIRSILRRVRPDFYLANVPELPLLRLGVPSGFILHDLGPVLAPAIYGWPKFARFAVDLARISTRASAILCVSSSTERELRLLASGVHAKTTTIGSGAGSAPPQSWSADKAEDYVLYAGTLDPNKNWRTLIAAMAEPGCRRLSLVMCGPGSSVRHDVQMSANQYGCSDRVEHRGYVSTTELSSLYSRARAFVFPSVFEGFGMPVVEAMSVGTPVVASDIPPIREAGGTAFLPVADVFSPGRWAEGIARVSSDGTLAQRLSRAGRDQSRAFTWEGVAERALGSLQLALAAARP